MYTTLISAAELAARPSQSDWLIVDCRHDLANPDAGEAAYRSGHIPGAVFAHLDRDLASPITPTSGRHPLPDPDRFAARLGEWGVDERTQVVAYDADIGAYAARLWWLLRWVGHSRVAVLDGGLSAWTRAGLPITTQIPSRPKTVFHARPDRNSWLDTQQVIERVGRPGWRLLDARGPERFSGRVEPIDRAAGHVPGAVNHPFVSNIGAEGRLAAPAELRARYERSQAGVDDAHTIVMCGSGVTACHLLLAMEVAGKPGGKLYAGSWSEWARDPARPVATEEKK